MPRVLKQALGVFLKSLLRASPICQEPSVFHHGACFSAAEVEASHLASLSLCAPPRLAHVPPSARQPLSAPCLGPSRVRQPTSAVPWPLSASSSRSLTSSESFDLQLYLVKLKSPKAVYLRAVLHPQCPDKVRLACCWLQTRMRCLDSVAW